MALFKHKISGQIIDRPAHYADHPILGKNLLPLDSPVKPAKARKAVEIDPTPEPLASALEAESASEIEVNIDPVEEN